jgi:hypothetical protein
VYGDLEMSMNYEQKRALLNVLTAMRESIEAISEATFQDGAEAEAKAKLSRIRETIQALLLHLYGL